MGIETSRSLPHFSGQTRIAHLCFASIHGLENHIKKHLSNILRRNPKSRRCDQVIDEMAGGLVAAARSKTPGFPAETVAAQFFFCKIF
jgi:hypothetical protein